MRWLIDKERTNRKVLDTFLRCHDEQGILKKRRTLEDLFAPETLGWAR